MTEKKITLNDKPRYWKGLNLMDLEGNIWQVEWAYCVNVHLRCVRPIEPERWADVHYNHIRKHWKIVDKEKT